MDVFSKSQGPPSIEGGQKGLLIFEVDGFDGGVLDGQALGEAGEEVLETNHIGSHRLLSGGLGVLEHATVKEVSEVAAGAWNWPAFGPSGLCAAPSPKQGRL